MAHRHRRPAEEAARLKPTMAVEFWEDVIARE
jgi:hypothetical protein